MSVSIAESGSSSIHSEHDAINNIVKLKLNKPKSWNWELSTSKSSPHICFPHIVLYDDKDNLLAEANEANCIINGATGVNQRANNNRASRNSVLSNSDHLSDVSGKLRRPWKSRTSINSPENERARIINSTELIDCTVEDDENGPSAIFLRSDSDASSRSNNSRTHRKCKRSVSTNSCDVTEFLEEFVTDLRRQGIDCKVRRKNSSERTSSQHSNSIRSIGNGSNAAVDEIQAAVRCNGTKTVQRQQPSIVERLDSENVGNVAIVDDIAQQQEQQEQPEERLPEIPILVYSERGLLQRDLNAKEFDNMRGREGNAYRRFPTSSANDIKRNETKTRNLSNDRNINSIVEKVAGATAATDKRNGTSTTEMAAPAAPASTARINRPKLNIQKSKSALEMPSVNMVSGQMNDKKKTRRNHSAKTATGDSTSYLERLSQFKRRSSSTDSQALDELNAIFADVSELKQPKYRLQSSPAGTLVVLEESFRQRKVRRRARKCSNIYEDEEPIVRPEKIVQKFTYSGNRANGDEPCTPTSERHVFERALSVKKEVAGDTYNHNDKFASRYEKAIANIDSLISKVILSHTDADNNKIDEQLNELGAASARADAERKSADDNVVAHNDDSDNPMADANNSNSIASHHKSSAIHAEDNALNGNSISTLIKKNNANHQQQQHRDEHVQPSPQQPHYAADHKNKICNPNGIVAAHINEGDKIANAAVNVDGGGSSSSVDNNAYVKQKKFKRKTNCSANNGLGNGVTMDNGNAASETGAEKMTSARKSYGWGKICRSASAGSQRFHLLSSSSDESSSDDDDIAGHNGQINNALRCDNRRANSKRNARRITTDGQQSASCENGKSFTNDY